ncbi:penicillin-binding protein 2 [Desulfolucanica intricata]|uniref:penicillin-binding protein 2 n=1 Tax=Desulfolucanica intricata TaxID=1285191 RepID=UPI00082FDDC4|nr:penicillin-binding protein 2 [Desulfolucanica intricata]
MERKLLQKNIRILFFLVAAVFLILTIRIAYLQLVETDKFQTLASENRIRINPIAAPRGEIFDRNNKRLVGNRPVYTVSIVYLGLENIDEVVGRLAKILEINPKEIQQKIDAQKLRLYEPVQVATNVSPETVTKIEERRLELPGVVIDVVPVRDYPFGSSLVHVLGYVREINNTQLQAKQDEGYVLGDMYGQAGLENEYEEYLRGEKGARQVEVDNMARPVRDLGIKSPVSGNSLVLSIDSKLQQAAERGLAKAIENAQKQGFSDAKAGALVMEDVRTGEILAMASYPAYDPGKFSEDLTVAEYNAIFNSPEKPSINRALGLYPPGSTFKMVVGAAAMESGTVNEGTSIYCSGRFKNRSDWKPSGHGRVDLKKAIEQSCNLYFWQMGIAVGAREIGKYAEEFGLGQKTGIDLPGEYSGVVPTPEYKYNKWKNILDNKYGPELEEINEKYDRLIAQAYSEFQKNQLREQKEKEIQAWQEKYNSDRYAWELKWHEYDTLDMSIGQGDNQYSPLQLVNYVAAIANGGTLYQPYLVKKIINPQGKTIKEFKPKVKNKVKVSDKNLQIIREGMHMVTLPPSGTAAGIFAGFPVSVAAKTGTAEVYGRDNHALFVAFAPADKPEVAVASVIEYGGHGGSTAGPPAREVLEAYFNIEDGKQVEVPLSPE